MQVFEAATATMMAAKGAIKPVYQLMHESGEAFDPAAYIPAIAGYYTDLDGNMLSFPFNSSTPNSVTTTRINSGPRVWIRTRHRRPGPSWKAWRGGLVDAGGAFSFSTEWPSWIALENFSAYPQPADRHPGINGFGGFDTELTINNGGRLSDTSPALAEWHKTKIFEDLAAAPSGLEFEILRQRVRHPILG